MDQQIGSVISFLLYSLLIVVLARGTKQRIKHQLNAQQTRIAWGALIVVLVVSGCIDFFVLSKPDGTLASEKSLFKGSLSLVRPDTYQIVASYKDNGKNEYAILLKDNSNQSIKGYWFNKLPATNTFHLGVTKIPHEK